MASVSFLDLISCIFPWLQLNKEGDDQSKNTAGEFVVIRDSLSLQNAQYLRQYPTPCSVKNAHLIVSFFFLFFSENLDHSTTSTDLQSISVHTPRASLSGAVIFTMAEINKATSNFSASNKIGEGGFGIIYKGTLNDGTVVAVKRGKKVRLHIIYNVISLYLLFLPSSNLIVI
jgi:hypothetical protein